MQESELRPYPGSSASPIEIVTLADEYLAAAGLLMQRGRPGEPLSRAPARLCAIHAIELYLNAFLLDRGVSHAQVRAQMHNLADRTELALAHGLVLRKLTREHLVKMTDGREYLVSRYGPEMSATLSQVNRLMATLNELAKKVGSRIGSNPTKVSGLQKNEPGPPQTVAGARSS